MTKNETKLRVAEALQDDAYKGIARIDHAVMKELNLKRGDVISIKGTRETIAIVDKAYPADIGEGIIRIDGIIRKNARAGVSENVVIAKADVKEAKKVVVSPVIAQNQRINIQGDLKSGLFGRAVLKGDVVVLGGVQRRMDLMGEEMNLGDFLGDFEKMFGMNLGNFGGGMQQVKFLVTLTTPSGACVIGENTEVVVNNKPVEISEETHLPEVTYEDIGG
jgi:transitional endoplasmic reticulum ATPase